MAEPLPRIMARRIIHARLMNGWGQGDLAKETGINQSIISRYESAQRGGIHPENLMKIADACGVTVDFLLGREPCPV